MLVINDLTVRIAGRTLLEGVRAMRSGKLAAAGADLEQPRQK